MQYSWPAHLLVMVVSIAAGFNFMKARNKVMYFVEKNALSQSKKWMGIIGVESVAMVIMLALIIPAIIVLNKAGPNFKEASGEEMFYLAWLGFSISAILYFLIFQPIAIKYLHKYVS
jgi:hypothetical protein